ncbi:MAG: phage tail spike protein [Faecalimonas umbilicata]|uniref:phage tail spike protein n=1 Tax=Faecalimonas umbilicata TaxID=1912855 RepID=UPI00300E8DCD
MQWFIIGRDMNVLANPSTDAEGSLPIDDSSGGQEISIANNVATGIYDFDTISNHKDSEHVKVGNYIAFIDKYGKHRLYTIMTVEGGSELSVHCEDIGLDLINEDADEWDTTGNPEPVAVTMERVLGDTGWTIGINEIADRKRATKYTSLTDSQLARIGMIMNTFEAECDFEIIMEGSKVVKQVVNIYQSLGQDFTNQRFVDEQNLVSLSRNESIEDLCTCMRCFGKENEETHQRLTIADVVYDDGRYYSPKGHTKIYDREAHDKWSRFRAYGYEGQTEFLGYINGTFEYDTDNAQELFNRGLSELKTKNEKKVAYEAELYDLQADIGDTIQIADHSFTEPTYISARIQSVKNHYTVKGEDTGVLANYKLLVSNPTKDVSKLLEELKNQVVSVEKSTVSYQKGESGTEVPTGEWSAYPVPVEAGKYLWTRTIITYTDRSSTTSYSVSKNGVDGAPGKPGKPGKPGEPGQNGVGIENITKYYLASDRNTGITTGTDGWTIVMQQITPEKKYLWSYENTAYTNGTSINTTPVIIGVHGDNGADGNPTGVTESETEPVDPYVGMLWKNTGTSGGRVQGAVYRWDGSFWGLFKFTASNIEAETFKGFDFIGANFTSVDEFISPHHIDDNTVVEAKHKVNLKISKGAIVATDDLYFKQGDGWTSSPQEHRLTQLLAGNGIYCYIEDYRTGERKRTSLDADGFDPPQSFFNLIYPVGSIYMSVNPTNPSELFPQTAWMEWGKGRVPVGVDTSQTEFNKAEKTGGSKTVTLTVDQMPRHTHNVPKPEWYGVTSESDTGFGLLRTKNPNKDGSDGFVSASAGGGKAHSNLQPYITCYMWVRTA